MSNPDPKHVGAPESPARRGFIKKAVSLAAGAALPSLATAAALPATVAKDALVESAVGQWFLSFQNFRIGLLGDIALATDALRRNMSVAQLRVKARALSNSSLQQDMPAELAGVADVNPSACLARNTLGDLSRPRVREQLARELSTLCAQLAQSKPGVEEITAFVEEEAMVSHCLGVETEAEAVARIREIADFSPQQRQEYVDGMMQQFDEALATLKTTLAEHEAAEAAKQPKPLFSDMASARKAGGYPVPEAYAFPKHQKRTEPYPSSGEWSRRI